MRDQDGLVNFTIAQPSNIMDKNYPIDEHSLATGKAPAKKKPTAGKLVKPVPGVIVKPPVTIGINKKPTAKTQQSGIGSGITLGIVLVVAGFTIYKVIKKIRHK